MMATRQIHYPHTIGFRVTDETWIGIQQEIANTEMTPHDWCRAAALERLNRDLGFSRSERIIFDQIARIQYLTGLGFQLLADNKLSSDEWRKLRAYAKQNLEVISNRVLEDHPITRLIKETRRP